MKTSDNEKFKVNFSNTEKLKKTQVSHFMYRKITLNTDEKQAKRRKYV